MSTLNPAQTALLVVHLQHDIVSAGTAFGSLFNPQVIERKVIENSARAMELTRAAGGTVVPLKIDFDDDYADAAETIPLLAMAKQAGALKRSQPGAQIVDEVRVQDTDLVLGHQRPGPFTGTDLHAQLQARGIKHVVVCGVATNASVEGAVRQASDLGYDTYVLADACSAADLAAHEAALGSMSLFGQALTVTELATALGK